MSKRRILLLLLVIVLTVAAGAVAYEWRRDLIRFAHKFVYHPYAPSQLGDGGPAEKLILFHPGGIARGPGGDIFIIDRGEVTGGRPHQGSIIWRLDQQHRASVFAGNGQQGDPPQDVPAIQATIKSAETMVFDDEGRVFVVDHQHGVVLRIHNGRLTRVAGTGERGYGGDGGPAIHALFNKPYDIARDTEGNLYVADANNHLIRKITPDGKIDRYAGTGSRGYSGDGGPARDAQLNRPYNITLHPEGGLLIGDSENDVIRRVDAAGIITTVVGTGERGYSGDGGPAEAAQLNAPQFMQVIGDQLYIGDEHNHVIRMVNEQGVITTVMGTGLPGYAKDGTPASRAPLNDPEGFLVNADGTMLVLDSGNHRVLRVDADGHVWNFAGQGLATRPLLYSRSN